MIPILTSIFFRWVESNHQLELYGSKVVLVYTPIYFQTTSNHQFTNSQLVDVQSNVPSKSTTYPGLNQSKLQPKLATVCSKPPNGRIPESWEIHLRGPGDAWLWLNQPTTFPRCVFFGEIMNPSLSIFFKYIAPPPQKKKIKKTTHKSV